MICVHKKTGSKDPVFFIMEKLLAYFNLIFLPCFQYCRLNKTAIPLMDRKKINTA